MYKPIILALTASIALLLLVACGAAATSAPTATPVPVSPTATPQTDTATAAGQRLYIVKGCAACHGQNAEGTSIAPGLAGHTPTQIERQLRAPVGVMPVFPEDKVSDAELEEIIEFLETLVGSHGHPETPAHLSDEELMMHLWMALTALEADNQAEATHHIGHALELVDAMHRDRLREALSHIERNDLHDAAHLIEDMVAGLESSDFDQPTMHLTMALSASRVEDTESALHHLDHFTEMAQGHDLTDSEAIRGMLHDGRVHDSEQELEKLLGRTQSGGVSDHHGGPHSEPHSEPHGGHP